NSSTIASRWPSVMAANSTANQAKIVLSPSDIIARMPNHGHDEGISAKISEYLQMIYNLEMEGEPAHGAELARRMGVSRANVSATIERMTRQGLAAGRGRGDIELTPEGRQQAETALRKHRLAERYLVDALGLD